MNVLQNKIVLITGASRGIGSATACLLASQGMKVAINYHSHEKEAKEVVRKIEESGGSAFSVRADVGDMKDVEKMVQNVIAHFGQLDFLVNNAGITADALFENMSEEDWQRVFQTNVTGAFHSAKAVLPHLREGSAIINISSVVGQMGNIGQVNYSASKSALIGFTKSLAKELSRKKIRVNAIAPGLIGTDMTKNIPKKIMENILHMIPLGKIGNPQDVAEAVLFLLQNEYITGEVLKVNGGLYM
ncbi:3-oxoacyl-ACP reductase FabG [Candidatus Peregrinibacteria bacterium]|nr:3-oxoacyl-ACP reductase FabG [Candidatus Peregrinibacteria bacterium]